MWEIRNSYMKLIWEHKMTGQNSISRRRPGQECVKVLYKLE